MPIVRAPQATASRKSHLRKVGAAMIVLVVLVGLAGRIPAVAYAAQAPRLLSLISLEMHTPEDSSEDEPILLINGRKVWRGTMSRTPFGQGDFENLDGIVGPVPFYENVGIVLKEEDWPDPDDFLGQNFVSASELDGEHAMWFTEDGARYKLNYKLETLPASFACDGGAGVYVYEHPNFRGRCSKFTRTINNISLFDIGNDAASSIRIVGNYGAHLFEHAKFNGTSSSFVASDADLRNDPIGDNRVTSIQIFGYGW